ncbi:shikimate kinase [Halosquirtibacter xylanolyticus]|uniref:shikimate kinase n=1 Tax=Halosquirtibacter xylanolyticus TaxID=3374599 RepID=UPI003747E68A|nr:shikimate kinase [Prolixibacteraceae bacterium]
MEKSRVYLNGYMAAGKSTIGVQLASALGFSFIDLDKFIEEKYFMSIASIFEKEGESGFREKERDALQELSVFENVVIATGGGTPCFYNNMDVIRHTGISIYLKTPMDLLVRRLTQNNSQRPIVRGKSEVELRSFIVQALEYREPFYLQSDIVCISEDTLTTKNLIDHIDSFLKE